ncbi:hypothetical protein [Nostoc sp. CCY0012]|uniref:hypothetical protein n=1 Tax=Nostoc sp. CCY0012 TaxID=1056123 RepID=UPI0039C5BDE6
MSESQEISVSSDQKPPLSSSDGFHHKIDPKESVNLEETTKKFGSFAGSSKDKFSLVEERKNYRTLVSGDLAKFLWRLLGFVVCANLVSTILFSWQLIQTPAADDREQYAERINSATANVNEASKTLYTFLGPLATAVTGYYFTSVERSNKDSDED